MLMELEPIEKLYQSYEKILDKARKKFWARSDCCGEKPVCASSC
ncbi:MAG: hypothetical protein CM1200mP16_03750 [Nitrospina sp.]|nr:MAG: hypothetical protein CM1200mP16_03750 [Nitrospina sp.]